jgi:hypothetical protein
MVGPGEYGAGEETDYEADDYRPENVGDAHRFTLRRGGSGTRSVAD